MRSFVASVCICRVTACKPSACKARANLYVILGFYAVGYLCCIIQCCHASQLVTCMIDCDCCVCRQLLNMDYLFIYLFTYLFIYLIIY